MLHMYIQSYKRARIHAYVPCMYKCMYVYRYKYIYIYIYKYLYLYQYLYLFMYITVALYNNTIHVCDLRCQEELLLLSNERLEVHRHIYIYTQTYIYTHISISISISIYPSIYITVALYIGMLPAWPEGTAAAFR